MARETRPLEQLSVFDGIVLICGMVIGAGIFKAPSIVAANTSSGTEFLFTWVLGGAVSLCGALVYAELAVRYPETGGEYAFLARGWGKGVAFVFAWARLTIGAVAATKMSSLLATHDSLVGKAADAGVHAKYTAALKLLGQAAEQLTAARVIRDQLVDTVDVSVLDEWISRNAAYDTALGNLYKEISKVKGRVTAATRAAVKAEAAARARLPPDTRGLVVIMADIGRGGMNGAVITIEEAKGKLSDALDADTASPSESPSDSPGPSDAPDSTDSPPPSSAP